MNKDFWDIAFNGKNILRLCINAKDFRIRKNKYNYSATFKYGNEFQIHIVYEYMMPFHATKSYYIVNSRDGTRLGDRWVIDIHMIKPAVENLTGHMLDCF